MIRGTGAQLREIDLVERCLEGRDEAILEVKALYSSYLESLLRSYGASADEAAEVVEFLWSDCVVGRAAKDALFQRFNGTSALRNWLGAIVINRWISLKRSESVRERALERSPDRPTEEGGTAMPDPEIGVILEEAIRETFASCSPEEIVMLRLVHFHQLNQKEVAMLWGWTESKMSRNLNRLQRVIANETLRRVRRADENLDLRWEDFLRLCDSVVLLQNGA